MAANGMPFSRIGVSIGRAQGNAVLRNRIKRLVREAFRLKQRELPCGFDILVTMSKPRQGANRHGIPTGASVKTSSYRLVAMNDSLLKLVDLCHKKLLYS